MIETDGVQPGGVIEFRLSGHVTASDYETVLIPAIETAIEKYGKLRTLFLFDGDFEGYELEAAWDDARVGLRHWNVFERVAVVADVGWIKKTISLAGFLVACPIQTFPVAEGEDARRWLRESIGSIHLAFDDEAHRVTIQLLGKLEPSAYDDVAEEIDAWMSKQTHIHLLLDLREFDGWQGLAALGEHLALVRDHRRVIERVAVVGHAGWQKMAVRVVSQFLRGEARHFGDDDLESAKAWLDR